MIIFLYGPDTFRSRQKLHQLKDKFVAEIDKSGLNIVTLDGEKLTAADFEKTISQPAFLAKKKMVIIEELIKKNKGQKIQKEILELLSANNLDDLILVFWEGELNQKRQKKTKSKTSTRRSNLLFEKLTEEKFAQEFALLNDAQVKTWIVSEIKQRGGKIEYNAIDLLAGMVGNNLWQLNHEIDKLIAFADKNSIDQNAVKLLVNSKINDDVFALTDALAQRNHALAMKLLSRQLKSGVEALELLSLLIWQFKNLLLVSDFIEQNGAGYPEHRMAFQIKLHPFIIKKMLRLITKHSTQNLKAIYQRLMQIDYQIKTSQTNPAVLFDLLIVNV